MSSGFSDFFGSRLRGHRASSTKAQKGNFIKRLKRKGEETFGGGRKKGKGKKAWGLREKLLVFISQEDMESPSPTFCLRSLGFPNGF